MSTKPKPPAPSEQPHPDNPDQARIDTLVRLLEEDQVGYRLERFVAGEREKLAQLLSKEEFSTSPTQGLAWADMFKRVQAYDVVVLPFSEFFAIGTAYAEANHAPLWGDFLHRIATCNQYNPGNYSNPLEKLALYATLPLLYGSGLLAIKRGNWSIAKEVLACNFSLSTESASPYILRTSTFEIIPQEGQRCIPGRENQYTPLLNHMYEVLKTVFLKYFVSEPAFADAFTRFEIIFATAYSYYQAEYERVRFGKVSDRFWTPPGRFWWQRDSDPSILDMLILEATQAQDKWSPVAGGLFGGSIDTFLELAEKIKKQIAQVHWR